MSSDTTPAKMGAEISSMEKSFSKWIQLLYEITPDRELFIFYDGDKRGSYTAQDVYTLAGRFACRLRHHGFKRHDVIANTLPNCPERIITDVGIILAGCVTMNGQVLLADGSDFFPSAKVSRCNGVIVAPDVRSSGWNLLQQFVDVESSSEFCHFYKPDLPELTSAILVSRESIGGKKPFLENLRTCEDDIFVTELDPEDIIIVFTTSGSTGYSKLVPRSSVDLVAFSECMTQMVYPLKSVDQPKDSPQLLYSDRMLGWIGGFPFSTYCNGDTRVLLDSFYNDGVIDPSIIVNAIKREHCPYMIVLPLEFDQIFNYLISQGTSWTKLAAILTGGQPLSKSVVSNMLKVADKVSIVYGSTESGFSSSSVFEGVLKLGHAKPQRLISYFHESDITMGVVIHHLHKKISRPVPDDAEDYETYNCGKGFNGSRLRVVRDDGELCQAGEVGTIHVQAPYKFRGYFNRLEDPDPQTPRAFTPDGWLNMDDNGYFDDSGDLFVMGRKNDVISYGASTLYPGWLEKKIMECPDVQQACVVPVSDPVLHHNICACLKPVPGSDLTLSKIKEHCQKIFVQHTHQGLAPVPELFLVLGDDFPETHNGKPDRRKLKELAEKAYGVPA